MDTKSVTLQSHEEKILQLAADTDDAGRRKYSTRAIAAAVNVSQTTVMRVINKHGTGPMPLFSSLSGRSLLNRDRIVTITAVYVIVLLTLSACALMVLAF